MKGGHAGHKRNKMNKFLSIVEKQITIEQILVQQRFKKWRSIIENTEGQVPVREKTLFWGKKSDLAQSQEDIYTQAYVELLRAADVELLRAAENRR